MFNKVLYKCFLKRVQKNKIYVTYSGELFAVKSIDTFGFTPSIEVVCVRGLKEEEVVVRLAQEVFKSREFYKTFFQRKSVTLQNFVKEDFLVFLRGASFKIIEK